MNGIVRTKGATGKTMGRIEAVVDLRAIAHNVREVRRVIGDTKRLMAVVKADGYGHGALEVSLVALKNGADALGVSSPEEGQALREAGIQAPIFVLGLFEPGEEGRIVEGQLTQTVTSIDELRALDRAAARGRKIIPVHLKVETGMGRIGVPPDEAPAFVRRVFEYKNIRLAGIYSHFANANHRGKDFTRHQLLLFNQMISRLANEGIQVSLKHIANSAAVLSFPDSYLDMVRPGIMIYGLYPTEGIGPSVELKPAMSLRTRIAFLKELPSGFPVSYGGTFITQRPTRVATIPVGYADGYNRLLSNRAELVIRGKKVPQIGTVCMDMLMADVTALGDVQVGDEVTLFGEGLPVEELAGTMGTINYEVICAISKRVPRVYRREKAKAE